MEAFFVSSAWIIPLVLLGLIIILSYWYGKQPFNTWANLGVKGPPPHLFFGNVLELFDDRVGFRASVAKWQKEYGRIVGVYFFRVPTLLVTDPDLLKQILVKEFNNFSDRFFVGGGNLQQRIIKKTLFFSDGADWQRIRRIMSPTFSSGKLRLLTHYMNLTAKRLGQNLRQFSESGQNAEAKKFFGAYTLDVICGTAFGLDTNFQQDFEGEFIKHAKGLNKFHKNLQLILTLAGVFPALAPLIKKTGIGFYNNTDVKYFESKLSELVKERKQQGKLVKHLDFLQLLLDAEADDSEEIIGEKKLSTEEIVAQGILFVVAGYETTAATLQYLSYELGKNQEVQKKMRDEIFDILGNSADPDYDTCHNLKYTEAVIHETLRMYPPVHVLNRKVEHDSNFNGLPIPAGSAIIIPVANIGRDPEFFPDPDTFNPDRFLPENKTAKNDYLFLPFGQGPRICLGMRLAMMEAKIALVHTLRNVRIVDSLPDVLDIEDYTGVLVPRKPIQLILESIH